MYTIKTWLFRVTVINKEGELFRKMSFTFFMILFPIIMRKNTLSHFTLKVKTPLWIIGKVTPCLMPRVIWFYNKILCCTLCSLYAAFQEFTCYAAPVRPGPGTASLVQKLDFAFRKAESHNNRLHLLQLDFRCTSSPNQVCTSVQQPLHGVTLYTQGW
jgi:hypothetical protein